MLFISVKRFFLFCVFFCISLSAFSLDENCKITFAYRNEDLKIVLKDFINKNNIPIIYINSQVDSIAITARCWRCDYESAIKAILKNTPLKWEKINNQIIIYNSDFENFVSKKAFSNSTLQGYIVDSLTNEPLPYAIVSIDGSQKQYKANEDGYFVIKNLPPDVYKLNILYVGYQADSLIADLTKYKNITIQDIKLNLRTIDLDAVVIKHSNIVKNKTQNETSFVVFDPMQLKNTPTIEQGDIVQNLRLLSSVSVVPDDAMGVTIRGGSSDQTLMLFDDIPIYFSQNSMGTTNLLNVNSAENVTLYNGCFPAQYSNSLSGIVNIKARKGKNDAIHAGVSTNLFTSRGYIDIPIFSKMNLFATYSRKSDWFGFSKKMIDKGNYSYFNFYNDVEYSGRYGTGFYTQNNFDNEYQYRVSNFDNATVKFSFHISANDTLSITYLTSANNIDMDISLRNEWNSKGQRMEKWINKGIALHYQRKWNDVLSSNMGYVNSYLSNNTTFDYDLIDTIDNSLLNNTISNSNTIEHNRLFSRFEVKIAPAFSINSGVEYALVNVLLNKNNNLDSTLNNGFKNASNANEVIVFAEADVLFLKRLTIKPGVNINKNSAVDKILIEPRVNARLMFATYFSSTFAYGQFHQYMHRTPSVVSYNLSSIGSTGSWIYSQEKLKPSFAEHFLVGLNFDTKKYSFHVSSYLKKYNDLHFIIPTPMNIAYVDNTNRVNRSLYIEWTNNREILHSEDAEIDIFSGRGQSEGVEFFASKNIGLFTCFVSYNISKTTFTFPYINSGKTFKSAFDRTHEWKMLSNIKYYNWNFAGIVYLVSGKPYPNVYQYNSYFDAKKLNFDHPINWKMNVTDKLPMYSNCDISASYHFKKIWNCKSTIGIVVHNVLDTRNVLSKYYKWNYTNTIDGKPTLEIKDQIAMGRFLNFFINIDL